jgi:hypothetical protein
MRILTGTGGEAELRTKKCAGRTVRKRKLFVAIGVYGKLRDPDAGAFGDMGYIGSKEYRSRRLVITVTAKIIIQRKAYTKS